MSYGNDGASFWMSTYNIMLYAFGLFLYHVEDITYNSVIICLDIPKVLKYQIICIFMWSLNRGVCSLFAEQFVNKIFLSYYNMVLNKF